MNQVTWAMAQLRSAVAGAVPQATQLIPGQLALNTTDRKIFVKDSSGAVVTMGIAPSDLKAVAFSGSYTDLTDKPNIQADYVLPAATGATLGGVKIGAGVAIDGSGVLTAAVQSVAGRTGVITLLPADSGLPNDLLDVNSKISLVYIPDSLLGSVIYQGTYDASTDVPTLPAAALANQGHYYVTSVAGTVTPPGQATPIVLAVTDWIISDGTQWSKVQGTSSEVLNVNGQTGTVTIDSTNLPGLAQVGKDNLYSSLSGIPTTFPPAVHTHLVAQITDIALVAKTNSYTDLANLPPDPTIANVGGNFRGSPALLAEEFYVFTRPVTFGSNFGNSQCVVSLISGATVGTIRIMKNGVQVGTITTDTATGTFTAVGPTTSFVKGDTLSYQWATTNIARAAINLQGNWTL